VRCIAIADVQASRREAGKQLVDEFYGNGDCVVYRDFRELLSRTDIDAVLVATGDRWHATVSMLAARAGKDVYSEKPCGLTISLCQQLADTIRETGRVFQAGTQRRSTESYKFAREMVRQGRIGEIVNAAPQERRRVLEDAAGIAGLHSRRHEAELRLNATEANLARLAAPGPLPTARSATALLEREMARLARQRGGGLSNALDPDAGLLGLGQANAPPAGMGGLRGP
jgi:hypothetical protein